MLYFGIKRTAVIGA